MITGSSWRERETVSAVAAVIRHGLPTPSCGGLAGGQQRSSLISYHSYNKQQPTDTGLVWLDRMEQSRERA